MWIAVWLVSNDFKIQFQKTNTTSRANHTVSFPTSFSSRVDYIGMQTLGDNINAYNNANTLISFTKAQFIWCPGYGETRTVYVLSLGR